MLVREYFNGSQAAIRAGYSENTAGVIAAQNLLKLNIQNYISSLIEKRSEKAPMSTTFEKDVKIFPHLHSFIDEPSIEIMLKAIAIL